MKRFGLCILLLAFLLICMSCSNPKDKIIGYWESTKDNTYSMAFLKGNKAILRPVAGEEQQHVASYKFLNDNNIEITIKGQSIILEVSFLGNDKMKLKKPGSSEESILKRINKDEFEEVAKRAAKITLIAKIKSQLEYCLTNLVAKFAENGQCSPVSCDTETDLLTITCDDNNYYFVVGDHLESKHEFSNGVVSTTCSFPKEKGSFEVVCK